MNVWIILYSKNPVDDICDSSICAVYDNEKQAIESMKDYQSRDEEYHYYINNYYVHSQDENLLVNNITEPSTRSET